MKVSKAPQKKQMMKILGVLKVCKIYITMGQA